MSADHERPDDRADEQLWRRRVADHVATRGQEYLRLARRLLGWRDGFEDACQAAFLKACDRPQPRLTKAMLEVLRRYDRPGNVRELQNVIERAIITSNGSNLRVELPAAGGAREKHPPVDEAGEDRVLTDSELRQLERDNVLRALEMTGGKVSGSDGAAALLGIKPTTLSSRMRSMKIRWIAR